MTAGQVRRGLFLALAGLLGGLGLVLALFGGGDALRRLAVREETAALPPGAPPPDTGFRTLAGPGVAPEAGRGAVGETAPNARPGAAAGAIPAPTPPEAPSFDIVRVEPSGEAVVAGRGAPNTVVEMLVDGKPVAKALADPNGQFAIVPPALPAGASEIRLRAKGADGREARSAQSVAVDVAPGRDRRPLVALTAPDRATVVLSEPNAPGSVADAAASAATKSVNNKSADGKPAGAKAAAGTPTPTSAAGQAGGGARPTRIVSVDAQEGGRLFVTATGAPGESVRLYLNDTLIAPGRVGPDGQVTFTIGRGVAPGQYRVRVDRVEPGTGRVRDRAEVPFAVPEPTLLAARDAPAKGSGASGMAAGGTEGGTSVGATSRAGAEGGPGRGAQPGAPEPSAGRAARAEAGTAGAKPATPPAGGGAAPDPAGVRGMAEAPGAAPAGAVFVPEVGTARISRGDNLWRISQRTYGRGERYTVIYGANQDQIRNPDLIYPGQTFVLPVDKRG